MRFKQFVNEHKQSAPITEAKGHTKNLKKKWDSLEDEIEDLLAAMEMAVEAGDLRKVPLINAGKFYDKMKSSYESLKTILEREKY